MHCRGGYVGVGEWRPSCSSVGGEELRESSSALDVQLVARVVFVAGGTREPLLCVRRCGVVFTAEPVAVVV